MAITQLSIFLENKPGQLHEVVKRLSEAGINIRAMTIAEVRDFGILRIIVSDVEKAKAVLEDDHIITTTEVVSAIMEDKAGALYDILQNTAWQILQALHPQLESYELEGLLMEDVQQILKKQSLG